MDMPPIQRVTTKDGYDIAFAVCGEGLPLVCMPGPLNHLRMQWSTSGPFRVLSHWLAGDNQLVFYDSRGQGLSTRGLGDGFRIDDYQIDLETLVDELGLDRFVLLGLHGFGRIAVRFAERHPEKVAGLILWNISTGDSSIDRRYDPSQFQDLAQDDWDQFVEAIGRITWAADDPAFSQKMVRESMTQADWLTRAAAWPDYNIVDSLPRLQMPTLLLAPNSSKYPLARVETIRFIASLIPDARVAIYDDPDGLLSHGPDQPPAVGLIREFVESVEGKSPPS